jgi:hypothetical protein
MLRKSRFDSNFSFGWKDKNSEVSRLNDVNWEQKSISIELIQPNQKPQKMMSPLLVKSRSITDKDKVGFAEDNKIKQSRNKLIASHQENFSQSSLGRPSENNIRLSSGKSLPAAPNMNATVQSSEKKKSSQSSIKPYKPQVQPAPQQQREIKEIEDLVSISKKKFRIKSHEPKSKDKSTDASKNISSQSKQSSFDKDSSISSA